MILGRGVPGTAPQRRMSNLGVRLWDILIQFIIVLSVNIRSFWIVAHLSAGTKTVLVVAKLN